MRPRPGWTPSSPATTPAGLAGADYPHAFALPDGRTLWLFQDAFIGTDAQLGDDRFAHNAALVQTGNCFELLPATGGDGTSWIGSWVEDELNTWLWPLDAEIGDDGHLWLFLAAVRNERGAGAAIGAEPLGTWRARYRLPDLELIDLEPAEDASNELFGYSIVSDDDWTYLYGHCYRQFDADGGFEPSCSPYVYLARVPRGRLDNQPWYWSEEGWTPDRAKRAPVLTAALVDAACRSSASATSMWRRPTRTTGSGPTSSSARPSPRRVRGARWCGTRRRRGARRATTTARSCMPRLENGQVVIAQSNNAWDMLGDAFADASLYRVGVRAVDVPGVPRPRRALTAVDRARPSRRAGPCHAVRSRSRSREDRRRRVRPSPRRTTAILVVGRILVLGLMGFVAVAASLGLARSARRIDPARRHLAMARLRESGPTQPRPASRGGRCPRALPTAVKLAAANEWEGRHANADIIPAAGDGRLVVLVTACSSSGDDDEGAAETKPADTVAPSTEPPAADTTSAPSTSASSGSVGWPPADLSVALGLAIGTGNFVEPDPACFDDAYDSAPGLRSAHGARRRGGSVELAGIGRSGRRQ